MTSLRVLLGLIFLAGTLLAGSPSENPQPSARDQVAAALQVKDSAAVDDVYAHLESIVWVMYGYPPSPEYLAKIKAFAQKVQAKQPTTREEYQKLAADVEKMAPDVEKKLQADKKRKEAETAQGIQHRRPQESLQLAAARLMEAAPELSRYEVCRRIIQALHTAWPRSRDIRFNPEVKLTPPPAAPEPPAMDPAYEHFLKMTGSYWADPAYQKLEALAADQLPQGAMLPLLYLASLPAEALTREGLPTAMDVVEKYGDSLDPALVWFLAHPEKYGLKLTWPRVDFLRLARKWPVELRKPLYEMALAAGWNEAAREMGNEEWMESIRRQFQDSPYGAPKK